MVERRRQRPVWARNGREQAVSVKKCIIASDSFKGTISSGEICRIARECARLTAPELELVTIPIADGGEGTADCFLAACGGVRRELPVTGPFGEPVRASYALLPGGTAVIELAACAGLPLAGKRSDPCRTTTYGVGELMRDALAHGARRILLGLGGSCTNDGGCGAAAALGAVFRDAEGRPFVPLGGTLARIASIDLTGLKKTMGGVPVAAMCDVDNPLFGPRGAAYVFAPQKGADAAAVRRLDGGLRALDAAMRRSLGRSAAEQAGAGAAGGFGAGASAFFGGVLLRGIDAVLNETGFDRALAGCGLVVTGEGRLDEQSLHGKAVSGVAARAKAAGVPVLALVGSMEAGAAEKAREIGVYAVRSINGSGDSSAQPMAHAAENYRRCISEVFRALHKGALPGDAASLTEGSMGKNDRYTLKI